MKPLCFLLEFSGYQHAKIRDEILMRPASGDEIALALHDELKFKCDELTRSSRGKMRVTVKRV